MQRMGLSPGLPEMSKAIQAVMPGRSYAKQQSWAAAWEESGAVRTSCPSKEAVLTSSGQRGLLFSSCHWYGPPGPAARPGHRLCSRPSLKPGLECSWTGLAHRRLGTPLVSIGAACMPPDGGVAGQHAASADRLATGRPDLQHAPAGMRGMIPACQNTHLPEPCWV